MTKRFFITSLILVGFLVASQAEAANFFQKIFKRGGNGTTTASTTKNWNGDCIVKAIDKREAVIGEAYSDMSAAISSALSARASALATSWSLSDRGERLSSRNTAWKNFNDSVKAARTSHKTSVKAAWASYKTDAANCRVDVSGVEPEDTEGDL